MAKIINLQLFNNTQTTLLSDLSPEMKTFYDMTLIDEAGPALVHDQFGQKRPIPKNNGKIIEFRSFDPLPKALTPLTEGVTPNGKNLKVTSKTAEVKQFGDYVELSDMLELTTIDNTIIETTKLIGNQAGLSLDTIVRNELVGITNTTFCPKVAANGTETPVTVRSDLDLTAQLTVDVIMQVVAKLRAQNAPTINGKYVAIIHPYVAYGLMRDPEWTDAHKYTTSTNLYEGEIGEIAGVRFVQTSEAKIFRNTADGGKDAGITTCPSGLSVFATLIFGKDAYGVTEIDGGGLQTFVKQKGSGGTSDPLEQRSTIGWKATKTAKLLIPNYLVKVESCSKRYSATAESN